MAFEAFFQQFVCNHLHIRRNNFAGNSNSTLAFDAFLLQKCSKKKKKLKQKKNTAVPVKLVVIIIFVIVMIIMIVITIIIYLFTC